MFENTISTSKMLKLIFCKTEKMCFFPRNHKGHKGSIEMLDNLFGNLRKKTCSENYPFSAKL